MKTRHFTILFLLFCTINGFSGSHVPLKFNVNGEFKILQFTDTHINTATKTNLASLAVIKTVTELEKPDLVILTGDIVTQENPSEGYQLISKIFREAGIPWAVVFGNHESERGFTRKQLSDLVEKLPGCLNEDVGGIVGNSNFILQVLDAGQQPGAIIWCMDSNAYSTLKPEVEGYGWFDFSQINWYLKNSREFTRQNNGNPLPALAFFHIPLPEYTLAIHQKKAVVFGVRTEEECSPATNSGMFTSMMESGDVMGTFVGHDHLNDYIAVYHNIALSYGRVSKIMKDKEDPLAGGRVIVLKQGKRTFDTWIREKTGSKVLPCSYPASFDRKD
ncbi:MAG: metallophosphoesterase family protein [Prolixibacteraceae bacterium]